MEFFTNPGRAANDRHTLAALGRRVRRLREEHGMSVDGLADVAEIEPRELRALEAGVLDPSYDVLIALARGLDISTAILVDVAGEGDD
jgi:transcriptional regulator with XRE-family HTH domain